MRGLIEHLLAYLLDFLYQLYLSYTILKTNVKAIGGK